MNVANSCSAGETSRGPRSTEPSWSSSLPARTPCSAAEKYNDEVALASRLKRSLKKRVRQCKSCPAPVPAGPCPRATQPERDMEKEIDRYDGRRAGPFGPGGGHVCVRREPSSSAENHLRQPEG